MADIKELCTPEGAQGNILYGKKWAVCGDSFTNGDFTGSDSPDLAIPEGMYQGKNKVYGYLIGNRNHMIIQHLARGGKTLAKPRDGKFTNTFIDDYQQIDEDVDYITLYFGINDSHHESRVRGTDKEDITGEIVLGDIDSTETNTFCGAWNTVLPWLIENRPFAHIGIIVSNGCDRAEFRTATIEIARKYGIPFIDLNGDDRTPCMIRSQNPDIPKSVRDLRTRAQAVNYPKNTHPNAKAHEYESWFIENFLRSI